MTIEPCRTCFQAEGCGIRLEKIRAVRGLKLTKIQFRCSLLRDSLKPGMKAQADLQYVATGYTHEEHELKTEKRTVECVVMGWSNKKVRIFVPYEEDGDWWLQSLKDESVRIHVLRVTPDQLHPYGDHPYQSVSVCRDCGLPEGVELPDWNCKSEDGGCYNFTGDPQTPTTIPGMPAGGKDW